MNQPGRLIAHSDWSAQAGAAPPPHPAAAPDRALELLQQMVQGTGADSGAGRTPDGRQWVAWWRIRGPGWYQVLVLPQERVNGALRQGLLAVVGVGLLVLLPALWWLRRRVRRLLALPLRRLTQAVDELAQGQEPAPIRLARADELGRLANAFDTMAADLSQQRRWQMTHAQALQTEVDERRQVMQRLQQERARLLALPYPAELKAQFDQLAAHSEAEQKRIEASDTMPFELYRQQYTAPQRLGLSQGAVMAGAESV
jgi:methyl-accepting chemotaxis protein